MKECKLEYKGGTLTLRILCEIDHHTAKLIREATDPLIEEKKPNRLVMDFSSVSFMDSSGIGLVLGRVAKAEPLGAAVSATGLCPRLYCLMKLSGLQRLKGLTLSCAGVSAKVLGGEKK